jgi:fimbrial chaperone protein
VGPIIIIKKIFVAFCVVLFTMSSVQAVGLSFSETSFDVSGKGTVRLAFVTNSSKKLIPIQMSVTKWTMDKEGRNINTASIDDFIIEPSQLLLRPNEKKVITIRYVGDTDIEKEETYQIKAAELPVRDPHDAKHFKIMTVHNMVQTVYVNKPNFKPELMLEKVDLVKKEISFEDEDGKVVTEKQQFFKLTFENEGTKRYLNRGLKVVLYPKSSKIEREIELVVKKSHMFLADSTLIEYVPWPEKMKTKKWKGHIKGQK